MTWRYQQSTHTVTAPDGVTTWSAGVYSGNGAGLNNPAMEADPDVGPIPAGTYKIGPAIDPPDHLGPMAMPLTVVAFANPDIDRSGFFWHGDNVQHDQSASHGCIVSPPNVRQEPYDSGDDDLIVVP
jgi:hypothetical protein